MINRRCALFIVATLAVALGPLSGCRKQPSEASYDRALDLPTRFPPAARVVAIGDLHGDLNATRSALRLAGAVDENDQWIGGDLIIVQVGDILDRGDDGLEILDYFDELKVQAEADGGAIHLLNGNHELMNVKLDMRYVSIGGFLDYLPEGDRDPADATAQEVVDGLKERILAFRPGGAMALRLAERNVIAIVGDTVFVHGGVLPHIADYGIERLNQETRDWIRGDAQCPPEFLLGTNGPVWSRHYSDEPDAIDCRRLEEVLETLDVHRMVVGHTVQGSGISSDCDDRVWRIDVGMAEHYGGEPAVLELSKTEAMVLSTSAPPR